MSTEVQPGLVAGASPHPPRALRPSALVARMSRVSTIVAAIALVAMTVALVADVALANLAKRPMIGMFDFVETMLVVLVFLGFPETFLRGGHIAVDVIDHFVRPATVDRLKWLAALVSLAFLVFLAWQMVPPALDAFRFGERKQELGLPLWALWVPMILGVVLSALALVAVVLGVARASFEEE